MLLVLAGLILFALTVWWTLDVYHQESLDGCAWIGGDGKAACEADVEREGRRMWVVAAVVGAMVISAWGLAFWYLIQQRRSQDRQVALIDELGRIDRQMGEDQAGRQSNGIDLGLNALWIHNRDRLDTYHKLVTEYANDARRFTILALAVGFGAVVAIGLIGIFVSDTTGGAISASVITAAGAALTGFIGRAVIVNTDNSSKELATFAAHPIEVERALNAERIIQNMPEDKRSEAQLLLVKYLTVGLRSEQDATE